jgi:hypothetical protein
VRTVAAIALTLVLCVVATAPLRAEELPPATPAAPAPWFHMGPVRIRDLTPFGILRLDFLPAHAVTAVRGTWAIEVNLSYQNTFVLSENVADYLRAKGGGSRVLLSSSDVAAIAALPGDAFLVDGELGVFDLTSHYRFSSHWGGYVTLPLLVFQDGFLDSTIEGFHDLVGIGSAHRDLVERNHFFVVTKTKDGTISIPSPPKDGIADPVVGARYSLRSAPDKWNVILEAAVKLAFRDARVFVSSGETDYGLQVSYQRFFRRQALYLTASVVRFGGVDIPGISNETTYIPTGVLAYEFKIRHRVNGILQLYASPSVIRNTDLDELKATKYLATLGIQAEYRGWFYRFAVTENVLNFENTADIAVTLSFAKAFNLPRP